MENYFRVYIGQNISVERQPDLKATVNGELFHIKIFYYQDYYNYVYYNMIASTFHDFLIDLN